MRAIPLINLRTIVYTLTSCDKWHKMKKEYPLRWWFEWTPALVAIDVYFHENRRMVDHPRDNPKDSVRFSLWRPPRARGILFFAIVRDGRNGRT